MEELNGHKLISDFHCNHWTKPKEITSKPTVQNRSSPLVEVNIEDIPSGHFFAAMGYCILTIFCDKKDNKTD